MEYNKNKELEKALKDLVEELSCNFGNCKCNKCAYCNAKYILQEQTED